MRRGTTPTITLTVDADLTGHAVEATFRRPFMEPLTITNDQLHMDVADGTITTGTSSGGGSSKNVQVAQSTSRAASSTYTELISLTCATSGTYDVYWSGFRSSTGGTWGSQLYVNDTSRGSVQSTFTNHIQNVHLTGISLSAGDDVAVRARSRGSNYYAYIGTLTIVQTS